MERINVSQILSGFLSTKSQYRSAVIFAVFGLVFSFAALQAQTAIGGLIPDPSATLDVQSTAKGVLFPRMTTVQRNAIASPGTGLMIYNTTIDGLEINLGTPAIPSWQVIVQKPGLISSLSCGTATFAGPYLRKTVAASGNSVQVPYTGGNGGPHNGQTVTSTGVSGLTATLTPGSFASAGANSLTYAISGTPAASGFASFALDIGGQTCTLTIPVDCGAYVAAGQWKEFSCHNLGAVNTSADPFTPSWEIIGNYYQWGTNPTCFGLDGTDGTNPCSSPVYGAAGPWGNTFSNDNSGPISNWNTTPAINGAWLDASKTTADPCPAGFRVPSKTQWEGVINNTLNPQSNVGGSTWTVSHTNYSTGKNFGPALFLPAAGNRVSSTGTLFDRGSNGYYWSSTESGTGSAWFLLFVSGGAFVGDDDRTDGLSVRCVAE